MALKGTGTDLPRVSILMTIYNAAPFLRQSIESLLAQSFTDWELIAVENGSTDGSPSILTGFVDPRIRVFSFSENIGRTFALRHAFTQARGEYIAVLDADDVAYPERLRREVEFLDSHPETVLVGTWAEYIDAAGRVFNIWEPPTDSDEIHDCLGWINPIVHSSAMYRRKFAVLAGGYPQEYVCSQDFSLILALARFGRLAVIGECLCKFRILPGSMTHSIRYRMDVNREGFLLMEKAGNELPLSVAARCMNRRAVSKYRIRYGLAIARGGDVALGLRMVVSALWCAPSLFWANRFFRAGTSHVWLRRPTVLEKNAGKRKIAIVCSTLNQLGGPGTHIRNIYNYLDRDEFGLTLIFCSEDEKTLREFMIVGGVDPKDMLFITHAQKRMFGPFIFTLRNILAREKFDVVHAFETQTQVIVGLAAWLAGVRHFVCNCEAQFLPSTIAWPKRFLFTILNFFLKGYFERSIIISHGLAKELTDKGLRPKDKIEVVHLGIPVPESLSVRREFGRRFVIGSFSRLSVEKGLDRFINAAELVVREVTEARFVICGDGKEEATLKALVRAKGLEGRFDFKPWTNDIFGIFQSYDIYVMPSLREGLGISLLEAMVQGLPCVASDIEGIRDVIENGVDGFLVDTADEKTFAQTIINLCRHPDKARQIGVKAFEKVKTHFSVEREVARLREIYFEILTTNW